MATDKPITRNQLAKFLPDHELIKAFERLLRVTANLTPDDVANLTQLIVESGYSAGVAENRAEATPMHLALDYIDFTKRPKHVNKVGRAAWNADDDTLNIHHTGNVTQQVGLETYIRVTNNTGATLPNGAAVGFSGAGGLIEVSKYLADGSMPSLYAIGVLTQDIPNGANGRATILGAVRAINTTGAPYGETWLVGDILYASPATAGGLTNIKPTAPSVSVPLGAVLSVGVTGSIFVRPTIEQQKYYGSFNKTTTQSPAVINTAYPITLDAAAVSNGVSVVLGSRITVANAGLYEFDCAFQLASGSASTKNVWLWFRKNGTDIANTSFKVSLESNSALSTPSRSMFFSLVAGDYIELMWAADSTAVILSPFAATAFAPAAPACIVSVDQVQQ